jgi:predicted negative regulator of RcsB-dependent stress response
VWAAIKAWFSKAWLWLLLALLVACGVLFALLRWERAKRKLAESRARTAEALGAIRQKRHQAALGEMAKRREADATEREDLERIESERTEDEAEHTSEIEDIESAAGDDDAVRDKLKEALRREE